jgi:hypothetical protein
MKDKFTKFKIFGMIFWREKHGVVSPGPVWCCTYSAYLHTQDSLPKLLWELITEFRNDKHLVG